MTKTLLMLICSLLVPILSYGQIQVGGFTASSGSAYDFSLATTFTLPAITVFTTSSAVSGGIPYFSSTTHFASSAILGTGGIVYGGGAGTAPAADPTHMFWDSVALAMTLTTTGFDVLTLVGPNFPGLDINCTAASCTSDIEFAVSGVNKGSIFVSTATGMQFFSGGNVAITIAPTGSQPSVTYAGDTILGGNIRFLNNAKHIQMNAANSDTDGTVTVTNPATTGTLTFAGAYTSAPACVITPTSNQLATILSYWVTATTTVLTVNVQGAPVSSVTFNYHCLGNPS